MEDKVLNGLSKPKRQTKQQLTCAYIRENYLDYARLRYDLIADKLQLREETGWRYMTNRDINTIVCQASEYHDANITNKEVMTALHSDLVPRVHPLRDFQIHGRSISKILCAHSKALQIRLFSGICWPLWGSSFLYPYPRGYSGGSSHYPDTIGTSDCY